MGAGALRDRRVVEAARRFVPVKIDLSTEGANGEWTERYGITAIPAGVLVGADGREAGRHGFAGPAKLAEALGEVPP